MGPTPTPTRTLGIRLSCNFVNVYTIAYHAQYTRTCVHAHIPNRQHSEDPRAKVSVPWNSSLTVHSSAGRCNRQASLALATSVF